MRNILHLLVIVGLATFLAACEPVDEPVSYPPAVAERVALVIGNETYANFVDLPGARGDADLVAESLLQQGFTLIGGKAHHDLGWGELVQLMRVFQASMEAGGVAIFYYSGHATQIAQNNFLVPVDANEWTATTVDTSLVRLAGSFRPPADREPRIKLIVLDRTLPGPLMGGPSPLVNMTLARETLEPNEAQIFAAGPDSFSYQADLMLNAESDRFVEVSGLRPEDPNQPGGGPSVLARAFADAMRTPFNHVLSVVYQITVMVADRTNDHQHPLTRFGSDIQAAGPLVGEGSARSLLARLEQAERETFEMAERSAGQERRSVGVIVGTDTRSIRAVSDTVATLTVLNLDDTFPLSRSGRAYVTDPALELARLEAWRTVLEQSRASALDDYQKAAVLSVTASASGTQLRTSGIDTMLEQGNFEQLPFAILELANADRRDTTAAISVLRRRLVEQAVYQTRLVGRGAGGIVNEFLPMRSVDPLQASDDESRRILATELNRARDAVASCTDVPLNANQMEAMASFAVSITVNSFLSSSMCRRLGDGDLYAVARELAYSTFELIDGELVHDQDLTRRRAREAALFLTVTQGTARDRLRELRVARQLEDVGVVIAEDEEVPEEPIIIVEEVPTPELAPVFAQADGLRTASFFIRMFEGMELSAYQDAVGIWTIGFGTTGDHVQPGMRISEDQAMQWLTDYVEEDWARLEPAIEPDLRGQEEAAILSLSYNVGRGNVLQSTLLRNLNAGDITGAADQFLVWNKARIDGELTVLRGLDRRRKTERALFMLEASPTVAADMIINHTSFTERAVEYNNGYYLVGYGRVSQDEAPRRLTEADARTLLDADLTRVRAEVTNRLTRQLEPAQIEALVVMGYVLGIDRLTNTSVFTYINEGNTQAVLAAVGYWDESSAGPGGNTIENWNLLRADAAALFILGY